MQTQEQKEEIKYCPNCRSIVSEHELSSGKVILVCRKCGAVEEVK